MNLCSFVTVYSRSGITPNRIIVYCLLVSLSLICSRVKAQCVAVGPNQPTITATNTLVGSIVWSNLTNILLSDNAYASATAVFVGDNTNYVTVSGFGFSIPTTATICGITVEIEKSATGLFESVTDNSVKIIKGGVMVGTEMASAAVWPTTDAFYTYGSSSSNWGTTWTPANINASSFGVAISANLSSGGVLPTARVDDIRITVNYNNTVLPIELKSFDVQRTGEHRANLSWITSTETNNQFFDLERSTNGDSWTVLGKMPGAGNSSTQLSYAFTDNSCPKEVCYFRLKQTDYNGDFKYSRIVSLDGAEPERKITITQDPVAGYIRVESPASIVQVSLMDLQGRELSALSPGPGTGNLAITTTDGMKGICLIKVLNESGDFCFKKIKVD